MYWYVSILALLVIAMFMFGGGSTVAAKATSLLGNSANGTSVLNDNKEKFSLESNPVGAGLETSTAHVKRGEALTTVNPSDLLPKDSNESWANAVSGGNTAQLADQIVPAELMDPSRQPKYTSTSKSKIPNWQLRADPPVDRSVTAGQFWNLTPDVQPDLYKNRGVEITAVRPTEQ